MTDQFWPERGAWALSYPSDVFGPLFMGDSVKEAAIETLTLWTPTYAAEVNRQRAKQVVVVPRSYLYRAADNERPIPPGSSEFNASVPTSVSVHRTAKLYQVTWRLEVRAFFAGTQDWNQSEAIGHAYGAVVVGALGQHPDLGGFAESTLWQSTGLGNSYRSSTYNRVTCTVVFHVVVSNSMSTWGGPAVPSVGTPAPVSTVESTELTVEKL